MQNNTSKPSEDQEIDLIGLIRQLWSKRKFIIKITAYFIVVGLLIALFSSKEYSASCEIVPQSSKNSANNNMARLASLAGMNMGGVLNSEQTISPMVYPNVLGNTEFLLELLQTKINIKEEPEAITLLSYLSDKKYQNFSLVNIVLKYTLGLPGLIMTAIKGEPEEFKALETTKGIVFPTKEERRAIKILKKRLGITIEEKDGYINISAMMPESYAAAQVAQNSLVLLQKYITKFKIDKVQQNLLFVQERHDELKRQYEQIHVARANYRDANQAMSTSRARTELERLDNQYNMAYSIYSEIASQLEQSKIQVKETTPVLTVVSPVTIPNKPVKPRRMLILVAFTFLGGMTSCGYVLFAPTIKAAFRSPRKEDEDDAIEI